jgi:hypothetical protein
MTAPLPSVRYPRPPANLEPYVAVLGPDLAIDFLLRFGGARLYVPSQPGGRSAAEKMIGAERLRLLSLRLGERLTHRVPIGNRWIVAALAARGASVGDIARTVRVTDVSVIKWLRLSAERERQGKSV